MVRAIQGLYRKRVEITKEDPALANLLQKVRAVYGEVMNKEWLTWGTELMPDMLKMIRQAERQVKIEREMLELAERKENRNLWIESHNSRKAQYAKDIMLPGASIAHLSVYFIQYIWSRYWWLLSICNGPADVGPLGAVGHVTRVGL